jgi:hypothetical protein
MGKKTSKFSAIFAVGYLSFAGIASAAAFDIWAGTGKNGETCNVAAGGCSLCDGLQVAINVVNGITTLAVVITVGMTVYGAVRMMLSGGSEQMVKDAKGIITSAVIGFVIVLCGWLIVNTFIHIIAPSGVDFPWATIKC